MNKRTSIPPTTQNWVKTVKMKIIEVLNKKVILKKGSLWVNIRTSVWYTTIPSVSSPCIHTCMDDEATEKEM